MPDIKELQVSCCPTLLENNHCDVIKFSRVLSYPVAAANNRTPITVEVILHFQLSRCTLGLTLGDPVYSITLLPGEKVRLSTTDRRSRFTYDSESKLSYRSEQIQEDQYFMTATQKYLADASATQSGSSKNSEEGNWDFHGDANGSIGIFSLSASASTKAGGSHNSYSVSDYLNQQKTHAESAATQAVDSTRKAHAISIGEVSNRQHIEGESEDHFEASSREFSNYNKCHAVTYMFYRLDKKQKVTFELLSIEKRIVDDNAPIAGYAGIDRKELPFAFIPQDIPVTSALKKTANTAGTGTINTNLDANLLSAVRTNPQLIRTNVAAVSATAVPIDGKTREAAIKLVNDEMYSKGLLDKGGNVTKETQQKINFEMEFSLPTPGIIVKGCLDECDVCEPLLKERMQLENDLLRKQIELLEKSQEYRCCAHPQEPATA